MDKILDSGTENWLQAVSVQQQVETLLRCNEASAAYGLVLSQADCALLLAERQRVLKQERRVELGRSILPELVRTFCASPYLSQDNYVETLLRLQEIFSATKMRCWMRLAMGSCCSLCRSSLTRFALVIWTIWKARVWIFLPRQFGPVIGDSSVQQDGMNLPGWIL